MKKLLSTLAILALFAVPALAQDMTGSYAQLDSPSMVNPGDTGVVFTFYVYCGSPDYEWIRNLPFTFPACFTVTDGSWDDSGASSVWSFDFAAAGNVAQFLDNDAGYGEVYDGDGGYFYVTVDVGTDCDAGPAMVHYLLEGDDYGNDPHFVEADLDFTIGGTATDDNTWSSVKSLY